jgi:hypothetical protein
VVQALVAEGAQEGQSLYSVKFFVLVVVKARKPSVTMVVHSPEVAVEGQGVVELVARAIMVAQTKLTQPLERLDKASQAVNLMAATTAQQQTVLVVAVLVF